MSRIALLAAFFAASVVSAAEPQSIPVWTLKAGHYTVAGGKIVNFPPSGPVVPPVDDPVVPPPVVPDDAAKLTADLIKGTLPASDTRHKNAIKFAGTCKLLADQAKEKQLTADAIIGVYPQIMAYAVPDADWKHIHAAVLAGLKSCPSPAVCASTLEQYAAGAMSTVPSKADPKLVRGVSADEVGAAAEEYGLDWKSIMDILLPLLMKLLLEWLSFVQYAAALIC